MAASDSKPPKSVSPVRYVQVASHVRQLVERSVLRPGMRIPSVRRLSRQQKISIATVQAAYRLLERDRVIESRPRSGFFVARPPRRVAEPRVTPPPAEPRLVTVSEHSLAVVRSSSDPQLVPLGAAVPSLELLPAKALARLMGRAARQYARECTAYDRLPGCRRFREQVAKRAIEAGCAVGADEIVVTHGTMEALHLALRAVAAPGDIIAVESPAFFGTLQLLESLGLRALEIDTDPRTGIVVDKLQQALERHPVKACLFNLNFQNPTGACMPDEVKRQLVQLLAEWKVPLIEDDLYGELPFYGARPHAAKAFDTRGLVLWCASLSKTLSPGLRAGWIAPGNYYQEIERLKAIYSITNAPAPLWAAADFLESGQFERHLRQLRGILARNVAQMTATIAECFPVGTQVAAPDGGLVLWVELPSGTDSMQLQREALQRKIGLAPGPLFSASGRFQNCIRLNCALPLNDVSLSALAVVGQLAQQQLNL